MAVTLPMAISSAASAVCSALIVASYVAFPALQLDPATSLMWWSTVDGLVAVLWVWQYLAPTESCDGFAFFTQLFVLTSQTIFASFAIDLVYTLRQPFDRVSAWVYHAVAWGTGACSAVILLSQIDAVGISIFGFCWVREVDAGDGFNWWLWTLFYIPTSCSFVVAWYASLFGALRLRRGLPRSFAARERSIRALQLVVHVNFTFFCVCGLGYVADLRYARGSVPWLTQAVYACFTGKGVVNMALWLCVHSRSLASRAPAGSTLASGDGSSDGELEAGSRGSSCEHRGGKGSSMVGARSQSQPQSSGHGPAKRAPGCWQRWLPFPALALQQTLRLGLQEDEQLAHALRQEVVEVMLKGIRTGVRRAASAMDGGAMLHASDQYAILGDGLDTFPFFDYRPHAFLNLRRLAGVSAQSYLAALSQSPEARSAPGGKSGAFLYATRDQRFILKTCTSQECATLISILDSYSAFLAANPRSLVCRFVGCHSIEMYSRRVHLVVMVNVFHGLPSRPSVTYDLKGSHLGRSTHRSSASAVRLDNDLAHVLWLPPPVALELATQLRRDAEWLMQTGLLDYSLIVGLVNRMFNPTAEKQSQQQQQAEAQAQQGKVPAAACTPGAASLGRVEAAIVEGPGIFAFGVVDILQTWTLRKRLEWLLKAYVLMQDPTAFSAVPPSEYGARFQSNVVERLIATQAAATAALLDAHGKGEPQRALPRAQPREEGGSVEMVQAGSGPGAGAGAGAPLLWLFQGSNSSQGAEDAAAEPRARDRAPSIGMLKSPAWSMGADSTDGAQLAIAHVRQFESETRAGEPEEQTADEQSEEDELGHRLRV